MTHAPITLMLICAALSACATQPQPAADPGAPGFFYGLLHGGIAPVSFLASFFSDVRVYAFPNSGVWYDLGFLLGVTLWAGSTNYAYRSRAASTGAEAKRP